MATSPVPRSLISVSRSVPDMFLKRVAASGGDVAWKQRRGGAWVEKTWLDYHRAASSIATFLIDEGLAAGDKITIVGSTREEWCLSDLGGQLAGLVTIGAYPTLTPGQLAYIVEHSDSKVVFVEDREQLHKVLAARARTPALRRVVLWDGAALSAEERADGFLVPFATLLAREADERRIAERVAAVDPKATAIIIYTSGTTGPPKGAMISHDNVLASLDGLEGQWTVEEGDWTFSFLPLAHAAERICGLYARLNTGVPTAFAGSLGTVLDEVKEARPTYFGSVPRIFEKAYARIQSEVEKASPAKQRVFRWAERVGIEKARRELAGKPVPTALALQHRIADRLVFQKLRAVFGGRVKLFATGAAPIALPILEFFWGAGFPIFEVYGMTEATCVTHANRPGEVRLGSVGRQVRHVETKIAEDGEVLVRGRIVFQGYYKNETATAEAIDAEGWLHTGDIGKLDADGYLRIVDRKKHILITSGGKNLAPANIENAVKSEDPIIAHVHAHADRRPYVTALITLNPIEALEWTLREPDLAALAGAARDHLRALMENPLRRPEGLSELFRTISGQRALRERIVDAVRRGNRVLARVERVKRVLLLDRELSMEEDELTPTLKVKRKNVEQKFAAEFDRLYADAGAGLVVESERE